MKKQWLYLAAVALACSSCGKVVYPVSGKATYKGVPAAGATVFLYRQDADPMNEPTIMGIVQGDGSFTLVTGSLGKGVPPGEYDVLIEWKAVSNQPRGRLQKMPDRLKGRYSKRNRPLLHVTVKPETNQLAPFELSD